ncbi:MAG: hypothetical protein IJG36_09655 [Synergistaceae bacterium]|nr:hypothetical protein [Synergistaceae bacterium]
MFYHPPQKRPSSERTRGANPAMWAPCESRPAPSRQPERTSDSRARSRVVGDPRRSENGHVRVSHVVMLEERAAV